jgi:hypothetical protein
MLGRFAFAICVAATLLPPVVSQCSDEKESSNAWIVFTSITRNGQQSGSGVYLKSGLVITAAHLTALDANMGVRIANRGFACEGFEAGFITRCRLEPVVDG